jgi:hypothetical protein
LRALGYHVTEQPVERGCANILATIDDPVVVFSTHFDCVPPFFPSRVEDGRLIGRGACDAKGILAAQVRARNMAQNYDRVPTEITRSDISRIIKEMTSEPAGARQFKRDPVAALA